MGMKFMVALAAFVFSTGLSWSAEEPVKAEESATVEEPAKAEASATVEEPVKAGKPAKKEPSPAQKAQREKMRTCNAEASKNELKGDERKKFMSECLKKSPKES